MLFPLSTKPSEYRVGTAWCYHGKRSCFIQFQWYRVEEHTSRVLYSLGAYRADWIATLRFARTTLPFVSHGLVNKMYSRSDATGKESL